MNSTRTRSKSSKRAGDRAPARTAPDANHAANQADHSPTEIGLDHSLCAGGFAIAVFSGTRAIMEVLAGECTARIQRKFVLADRTLSAENDFARTSGSTLPTWPVGDVRPIKGVCFVFTTPRNPAIEALRLQGAVEGEHFILTSGLSNEATTSGLRSRLATFLSALPESPRIALLGYGQQGKRIAACLHDEFQTPIDRMYVWDSNADSVRNAVTDGLTPVDERGLIRNVEAVIATPQSAYARITAIISRAREVGVATLDNAQPQSGHQHWARSDSEFRFDQAASRALLLQGCNRELAPSDSMLKPMLTAHIVRIDRRKLAEVSMPHLQSGQTQSLAAEAVSLQEKWHGDGLAQSSFQGLEQAFISLSPRAALGFFAARQLCLDIWPEATQAVFPSQHEIDLGATAFERLLKAHIDVREIVATMQTPAQRVALGVVASHYAHSRPIIEIGSALGGSMLHMAAATSDAPHSSPLISIDPDSATRDIMRFVMQREGYGERLRQIVKTSDLAVAELRELQDASGLVFIDGLHSAEAVVRDFRSYAPLVAVGGALAFHDVCPAIHSVMGAVVEHVLPDRRFLAKCLVDGLLVLERTR